MAYELLKQPLTVKKTTFPNRVVLAPLQTNYATEDGEATDRLISFHKSVAKSDVGLSIVGATGISRVSRLGGNAFCLYEDRHIEPAKKLFGAIKDAGSVPAVQICHGGRVLMPELVGGDVVGPSPIQSPMAGTVPRELSTEEVEEIIAQFVNSAEAAKSAGAEMVEFHGAHSYLLNQFLSPAANQRSDKYGGSTESRGRMVKEIIEKTRERVGADYVIGLRMSVDEYVEGGLTVEESLELIKMFIESSLDIIHVSAGGQDAGPRMIQEAAGGGILKLAGEIKKDVDIPVIAVGGILKLDQVEETLKEGLADMVAIGRALISDPAMVKKSLEGNAGDVEECTACLQCFLTEGGGMTCAVNEDL
jgi:2,4-dienoyl-CoA reductase-like NADH-dependent reductase (Old Yellow Enzyme family)